MQSVEAGSQPKLSFATAIEGLVRGLGPLVTDELRQKLKVAGLDLEALPPGIPAERMPGYFELMAGHIWPQESREEALRLLGLTFIRGWQHTLLGAAASAVLKVIGPERTLTRFDRAFRTSDNFTSAKTTMLGPKDALVEVNTVNGVPTYWIGIFQGGMEFLGVRGTVTLQDAKAPGAAYRLRWE